MGRSGYKMGDDELTLYGEELKVGDQAPDFTLTTKDSEEISLADLGDKVKIIASVPSIDTGVCEIETIRFNQEAGELGDDVVVLTVSVDLPFALQRFCANQGIENAITTSDYKTRQFGKDYGVLMDDLYLLNRSVFVLDQDNKLVYVAYNEQNTEEPDYDAALNAAKEALK